MKTNLFYVLIILFAAACQDSPKTEKKEAVDLMVTAATEKEKEETKTNPYQDSDNEKALYKALKKKTADTFLTIGFLNGFLPCGLVYMAVFASLAMQSAWQGSLYMALFGLGTIPLMTSAIYLGKFLNQTVKQRIQKAIPVFVIVIGLLFILRGLGLGIPYLSPAPITEIASSQIECH